MEPTQTQDEIEAKKSYVLSLCSAIGGLEEIRLPDGTLGQVYCAGDEALACLKDLKKAVRIDSQNDGNTVLTALVEYNLVEKDLVPLILSFQKDRNEVAFRFILACVELLVPMTWPTEKALDVEELDRLKEDPNLTNIYRKYKLDLLRPGVFEIILAMVMKSVRIPVRDRSVIDHSTIRLVLYLFRNLVAIPDLNTSQFTTMEQLKLTHLQENLLIRYYESDVIEFLLTLASNGDKPHEYTSEWNLLVLESLYNLVNRVDPKEIFSYTISDGLEKADLREISSKLSNLLSEENTRKRQKTNYVPTRHNRFGGTYTLDWDGKKRVSHKQVAGFADPSLLIEGEKKEYRVGVKRKLQDKSSTQKIYKNGKAIMYLKLTAQSFILSCFNTFYASIMKDMEREDFRIVKEDYSRYYYTMKWFLEYHAYEHKATERRRHSTLHLPSRLEEEQAKQTNHDNKDFDLSYVATSLDLKTVLFCLRHIRMKVDTKEWFDVQMGVDCFSQMLLSIASMAKSEQEEYKNVAEHIQSNLFYEQSHLDLMVELVKKYKSQSYGYLKSVVMVTHVLLRSLDEYLKGKKTVFVKRSQKSAKAKKKKMNAVDEEEPLIAEDVSDSETSDREAERDRQAEYREQAFHIEAFEKKYISNDVMNTYLTLLEEYMDLEPVYTICITSMFHRLMVKKKQQFLFWKLPVLDLFNRILQDSHRMRATPAKQGLIEFISFTTYQFIKAAKQYPLLFVEAVLPNIKSERAMWEIPNEAARIEKENYLKDVNYIPPSSTAEEPNNKSREQSPTNHDIIDEEMQDYLFSHFDRKKAEEAQAEDTEEDTSEGIGMQLIENKRSHHKIQEDDNYDDYDNGDDFDDSKKGIALSTTDIDALLGIM